MSNPAYSNIRPDCKLEYAWRDIQEAQKTGFEECKRKVLRIVNRYARGDDWTIANEIEKEIENLK